MSATSNRRAKNALFRKRTPKLLYFSKSIFLSDESDSDQPDGLPERLHVRRFDVFCYVFSMITYVLDIVSDALVASLHFYFARYWSGVFITTFVALPSIVLNTVSLVWWVEDNYDPADNEKADRNDPAGGEAPENRNSSTKKILAFRILACVCQVGPLLWYSRAIRRALKFRQLEKEDSQNARQQERLEVYCEMVEADRDASLLRFFECFLESMPQLMVQGFLVAQEFCAIHTSAEPRPVPAWMLYQIASISCSLLSACSAIVAQHRSLRISCPGKINMSVDECMLVLIWRASTLCARYISLVLFMLAFKEWAALVFVLHFLVSFGHIIAFQSIATDTSLAAMEVALLLINAAVHTFIPFNMAEGSTRRQYIAAYIVEFAENSFLLALCLHRPSFDFPYKFHLAAFAVASFALGMVTMIVYYAYFHPNRRAQRLRTRQDKVEEADSDNRANNELEQAQVQQAEPQVDS